MDNSNNTPKKPDPPPPEPKPASTLNEPPEVTWARRQSFFRIMLKVRKARNAKNN
jgi:hypothetical protein